MKGRRGGRVIIRMFREGGSKGGDGQRQLGEWYKGKAMTLEVLLMKTFRYVQIRFKNTQI